MKRVLWNNECLCCVIGLSLIISGIAVADSSTVSYQGTLCSSDGTPVQDGNYSMIFSLWTDQSSGSRLWEETHGSVQVQKGLFSVQLGETVTLGTLFSANSSVWLEVAADTGSGPEVFSPRVVLSSTPYAQQAANATNAVNATNATNADTVDSKHAVELAPPGAVMQYAGAAAPTGWLLCNGAGVSTTTYAGLFAAIGYAYGGSGATFNLPNLTGKVAVGRDTSQTEFATLGQSGGEKAHTMSIAEMPSHTHVQNAHTHLQDPHTHGTTSGLISWPTTTNTGAHDWSGWLTGGNWVYGPTITNTTATNQNTTATNQNSGGGGSFNVLQPYVVLNYIIKH